MSLDTFLGNLWRRSAGQPENWSWLEKKYVPTYAELLESEWSDERTEELSPGGQHLIDMCRARMVMGAMRYGRLANGDFKKFDCDYYQRRIVREVSRMDYNLEGFYDCLNLLWLSKEAGYHVSAYQVRVNATLELYNKVKHNVPYHPEDRV